MGKNSVKPVDLKLPIFSKIHLQNACAYSVCIDTVCHIHIHTYVHIIYIYTYSHTFIFTYSCLYIHMSHTFIYIYISYYTHVYQYIYIYTHDIVHKRTSPARNGFWTQVFHLVISRPARCLWLKSVVTSKYKAMIRYDKTWWNVCWIVDIYIYVYMYIYIYVYIYIYMYIYIYVDILSCMLIYMIKSI